jgi:hypothetical protein
MKRSTLVMSVIVSTILAATAHAQRAVPAPTVIGPTGGSAGGRQGIRPCSSLQGRGFCSPGPSVDVTRYFPPSDASISGGLRLQIRPSSAAVYVDKRYAGRVDEFDGNSERLVLAPGAHLVVVRAPGYKPLEIETLTRVGHTTVYRGAMSPLTRRHD